MRLKLEYRRPGGLSDDVQVTIDTSVTVGALAAAIARRDPRRQEEPPGDLTLRIVDGLPDGATSGAHVLPPDVSVADSNLRSGQTVTITEAGGRFGEAPVPGEAAATLYVESGPDAGASFPLRFGVNQVGRARGNDIRLTDDLVSKVHLRVNVTDVVEVVDLGSSNGTRILDDVVSRAVLRPDDRVEIGDTVLRVERSARRTRGDSLSVDFNRSPRLDLVYEGVSFASPDLPPSLQRHRLPIIPVIAPVVLGCIMFAITQQLITVVFVALSPIMLLGNVIEARVFGRRDHRAALEAYADRLTELRTDLTRAAGEEAVARRDEYPSTVDVVAEAHRQGPGLWSYRPDQRGFLELRLGLGSTKARNGVDLPHRGDAAPGTWASLLEVVAEFDQIDGVPIPLDLTASGSLGIAGPRADLLDAARSVVAQLLALHSPAEMILAAIVGTGQVPDWDWLKWLPHVTSDHSPLSCPQLAASPGGALELVSQLEDVIADRRAGGTDAEPLRLPAVVVLVEDENPAERSRLVELAERGRRHGVHLVWLATTRADLPAACRTFVDLDPTRPGFGTVGYVDGGEKVDDVAIETFSLDDVTALARSMAPVIDIGARVDDASDLPRSVSLVTLTDPELARAGTAVLDRWRTTDSLPGEWEPRQKARVKPSLRATVGAASGPSMYLDLREHGPHALVGGTTGSGKSEFLQSWVVGMALEHSPARVNFLFVDYKGGAAFGGCELLPHSVGMVTDLSPHLVRRVLTSLKAEIRRRERLLEKKSAKDLYELEKVRDPEAPASLVIVVDEFAALVEEVPEFVDGVVDIAQRGRSLGLHLILATQRPAGVIKDNLRANTNLRVALRVADDSDSEDVIGTKQAGALDPSLPGRGFAKLGPNRIMPFQAGYVGGWTPDVAPEPEILVELLAFGAGQEWEADEDAIMEVSVVGPNDLERLVTSIREANTLAGLPPLEPPWLDVLADVYDYRKSPQSRTDAQLNFGIIDDPKAQQQVAVAFEPDREGNMAVFGTGGSGKSTFLRTIAVAAGLGRDGGPSHVYGLDFGARGLRMLEVLSHVGSVVNGEDDERVRRLLRHLRDIVDERADRYAAVDASSIAEYRERTGHADEPRIILLVDNIGAFRQAYEIGRESAFFDMFQAIAGDGRPVGVHVVVSADRVNSIPPAMNSVIQKRLVLRLADDNEYGNAQVPNDILSASSPPGRGVIGDKEVQVTVLGGSSNTATQARSLADLAAALPGRGEPAPPILRLTEQVLVTDLPEEVGGRPTLGIADESLAPVGFAPEDVLLIVGPPLSGKTTTMTTIARSLCRTQRDHLVYLGAGRSPLRSSASWVDEALTEEDIIELAGELTATITSGTGGPSAIFLENVSSFSGGSAEIPLQLLVKTCRQHGVFFVCDAETGSLNYLLEQAVRAARHGIALQPSGPEEEQIFKTPFPRIWRGASLPGRGMYVRNGSASLVQCALPDLDVSASP